MYCLIVFIFDQNFFVEFSDSIIFGLRKTANITFDDRMLMNDIYAKPILGKYN